ncbi:hypothetical protein LPJ74_006040, partial [Coemansia sp. RSA 1843]
GSRCSGHWPVCNIQGTAAPCHSPIFAFFERSVVGGSTKGLPIVCPWYTRSFNVYAAWWAADL